MTGKARVCVGEIVGAHGVRGLVKLKSFTEDPESVGSYGPVEDEGGRRRFTVSLQSAAKEGCWLARIDGVADRDGAEALRGTRLYVDRAVLPEPEEGEFYHTDLIGLRAERIDGGEELGTVTAVLDFGAGTMLELRTADGRTLTVPFTLAAVPVIDVPGGRVVIDPPVELEL